LLIAVNPDEDSRLPFLLRVPQPDGDLLFRTSGTWPRVRALYCYPVGLQEWPGDAVIVERVPLRSCRRRGAAIDLILDRSRENRSQLVFTQARGRDALRPPKKADIKRLARTIRAVHAIAYDLEPDEILSDGDLEREVEKLLGISSQDRIRQTIEGIVEALDDAAE